MDIQAAGKLARELMTQHGLGAWRFEFDTARRRFGSCWSSRKLITLSRALTEINEETEVRDTILHEIAHGLAGHKAHHGPLWKVWARKVGARPERCYTTETTATLTYLWEGRCKNCGFTEQLTQRHCPDKYGKTHMPCWQAASARNHEQACFNHKRYRIYYRKIKSVVIPAKAAPAPVAMPVAPMVLPAPIKFEIVNVQTVLAPVNTSKQFDAAECVRLYKAGQKVVDIAVAMGYERGSGQNRVRGALIKAGVYSAVPVDFNTEK